MNKNNNIRLATAALVAVFALSSTNVHAMDNNPMPGYDEVMAKNIVTLNIYGSDVKFDRNSPEECFHALEKVCIGPRDFKIDNYVFPLAEKALSYNKVEVIKLVSHYFAGTTSEQNLEPFGSNMFTSRLDDIDRVEFWLDLGDRGAAMKAIENIGNPDITPTPDIFPSKIFDKINPKTETGQRLKESLIEYYKVQNLFYK